MPPVAIENLDALKNLVGREIGVSEWLTMTQERIQQFAEATGDQQWIHLDPERAKRESPYKTTVAHGFLTLSLMSYLIKQAVQIQSGVRMAINYGLNRVRFPAPVRTGSKIRARYSLSALNELPDGVEVTYTVKVEAEETQKPCCVAEWLVRYYR